MRTVILRFPEIGHVPTARPSACPQCGCTALQGWGAVKKTVIDTQGRRTVTARRSLHAALKAAAQAAAALYVALAKGLDAALAQTPADRGRLRGCRATRQR